MTAAITPTKNSSVHSFTAIACGDFRAFEALFQQYYTALCYHALTYLPDAAAVEDVVSDVFARLWEKRNQLQVTTSVKSYLYRAVSNQCIDVLRRSYHKRVVFMDVISDQAATTSRTQVTDMPERKELSADIEQAIKKLPRQCGIIFRMSKEAGLKYYEIAEMLDISVKTVETQMGRAFKALRLSLQHHRDAVSMAV